MSDDKITDAERCEIRMWSARVGEAQARLEMAQAQLGAVLNRVGDAHHVDSLVDSVNLETGEIKRGKRPKSLRAK